MLGVLLIRLCLYCLMPCVSLTLSVHHQCKSQVRPALLWSHCGLCVCLCVCVCVCVWVWVCVCMCVRVTRVRCWCVSDSWRVGGCLCVLCWLFGSGWCVCSVV